ncbi:MAG: aldose epimerase family protein [Sphaerochaetaceae bacterium]|nr:galactose mutarotase [Sphaerochaetaceae bacterium]
MGNSKRFDSGFSKDGSVKLFELNNGSIRVGVLNLGASICYVEVPDKNGKIDNVVLNFDKAQDMVTSNGFFGMTVGRFANRIANAEFLLNGQTYKLEKNDGKNCLHSGSKTFGKVIWQGEYFEIDGNKGVKFSHFSPNMEGGFPGNLKIEVFYILKDNGSLLINYQATCDKECPLNIVNHSYFNLAGISSGKNVLNQKLFLDCNRYLEVNEDLIPTGKILNVENTGFDFQEMKPIGQDFKSVGNGYDNCFVINKRKKDSKFEVFALAVDEDSGRYLKATTNMLGVQFYTGNFLDKEKYYPKYYGFCLETQYFPDSPNHSEFPSCILKPGRVYDHTTIYQFGCVN